MEPVANSFFLQNLVALRTRSQAAARIADHTASQ